MTFYPLTSSSGGTIHTPMTSGIPTRAYSREQGQSGVSQSAGISDTANRSSFFNKISLLRWASSSSAPSTNRPKSRPADRDKLVDAFVTLDTAVQQTQSEHDKLYDPSRKYYLMSNERRFADPDWNDDIKPYISAVKSEKRAREEADYWLYRTFEPGRNDLGRITEWADDRLDERGVTRSFDALWADAHSGDRSERTRRKTALRLWCKGLL